MFIRHNKQQSLSPSPQTFFNLSTYPELSKYSSLFSKGLKHIPYPTDLSDSELDRSFNDFYNSSIWKKFFYERNKNKTQEDIDNEDNEAYEPYLKIRRKVKPCPFANENNITFSSLLFTLNKMKKDISEYKNKYRTTNRRSKEFSLIKALKKEFPSVIFKAADKNLGIVALDIKKYNDMVLEHLQDSTKYELCANNLSQKKVIMNRGQILYNELVGKVNQAGSYAFTPIERKYLLHHQKFTIPLFHVLPKIHKQGRLKGRPIAGATNWVTTPISKILEVKLRPYVSKLSYTLKNSQTLVDELSITRINSNSHLVTADVESLYPNIILPILYCIFNGNAEISYLLPLVKFVCDNSYVQYDNKVYKQTKGIAMGTNCAVSLANIYMDYMIDSKIELYMNPSHEYFCIIGYKRYIDDLIFLVTGPPENFTRLRSHLSKRFLTLNYQYEDNNKAIFMDIMISKSPFDKKLHTAIYQKPMNKYGYLLPQSYHSPHTHKGFILGELTRYARICSDPQSYNIVKELFRIRLLNRGYSNKFLRRIFNRHNWTKRFETSQISAPILPFVVPYTKRKNQNYLESIFKVYKKELMDELPTFKPLFVYSTRQTIGSLLTRSALTAEESMIIHELN